MQKLSNQAQEFWFKLIDSELVKDTVSGATSLLDLLTKIVDKAGMLGTIGIGAGLFAGIKNVGRDKVDSLKCLEYADNIHNLHRIRWFRVCYS